MSRGVKLLFVGVVVLAISSALGFLGVMYVFDVVPNGGYTIESVYEDGKLVETTDQNYNALVAVQGVQSFIIKDRQFTVVNGDRQGGTFAGISFTHRLRGGFVGDLYFELKGFKEKPDEWVRFAGNGSALGEKITVKNAKVVWELAANGGHGALKFVYHKV